MNFEAENVRAEDGIDSPGEEASSWDPYLVSVVNDSKKPEKKHFSESMSGVLDEMGDTTLGRRATLLRMHEKD